ncbi:ABC transporter ATP-binding protein [Eubacterium sp. AB3007]|uniref:ABC transporter ATP-binding protein n=1 Tax=Eubacterium sp. AB3007 TaxID=1392487 RepID=UPI000489777C|nr:ABC transporter ATP-binding protein [Eubacterium sp. AB3007]
MKEDRQIRTSRPRGGGHGRGLAPGEKPQNLRKAIADIVRYMGGYRLVVVLVMLLAAASTVFQVIGPKVMGMATTEIAEGLMRKITGSGGIAFDVIARILFITMALYVASSVFSFLQNFIMSTVTQRISYNLRRDIADKIDRLPMEYFESRPYGDVLSRITNDVDTLGTGLNQSITQIITAVCTVAGVILMMLSISPLMTGIAVLLVPVSAGLMALLVRFSQPHFQAQQKYLGKINGQVEENFAGQQVIKAFSKEQDMIDSFEEVNDVLYRSAWKSQAFSGIMMPLMMFVGNLAYAGVAISGGMLAIRRVIGIGDIQAFIQYVKNLSQPISQVAQVMNQVQSMAAASERVFAFLGEAEEEIEPEHKASLTDVRGAIGFDHVRFGYDPEHPVIRDFSVDVAPGQKIAIVGPTGAGKTTIVKLLMRFYDVDAGSITLDGVDIRRFDRHELRESFGMVLQETWLFSGSIMENIRYGNPEASDEEVIRAAKAARVDHFIRTLPGGYDMILNENADNVSQGQKQLLTIARAILADNRVMILDEATSSVDTRTEEQIQQAMDTLMEGRTSFVIAHRLSTIRNADRILVMNQGDIIEQGTHQELLEAKGFYADMYNAQFDDTQSTAAVKK